MFEQTDFDLMDHRDETGTPEQVQKRGREVGNPKGKHLPGRLQLGKGSQNLLGIGEEVRPVQEQQIQVIHAQSAQAPLDRIKDVAAGKIKTMGI